MPGFQPALPPPCRDQSCLSHPGSEFWAEVLLGVYKDLFFFTGVWALKAGFNGIEPNPPAPICAFKPALFSVCLLKSMTLPSWNYAGHTYQGSPSVFRGTNCTKEAAGGCAGIGLWLLPPVGRQKFSSQKQTTLNLRITVKSGAPISSLAQIPSSGPGRDLQAAVKNSRTLSTYWPNPSPGPRIRGFIDLFACSWCFPLKAAAWPWFVFISNFYISIDLGRAGTKRRIEVGPSDLSFLVIAKSLRALREKYKFISAVIRASLLMHGAKRSQAIH